MALLLGCASVGDVGALPLESEMSSVRRSRVDLSHLVTRNLRKKTRAGAGPGRVGSGEDRLAVISVKLFMCFKFAAINSQTNDQNVTFHSVVKSAQQQSFFFLTIFYTADRSRTHTIYEQGMCNYSAKKTT